ncbi:MAG: CBS domain-containing protein [Candidatus Omnitrophota bacterium]
MQVKEVMSKEVITIKRSTTLKQILKLFAKFHIFPLLPVVEDDGRLVGVVSLRNLINVFQSGRTDMLKAVPFLDEQEEDIFKIEFSEEVGNLAMAEDIMESKFTTVEEDTSLEEAYKQMKLHLKEEIPVVDKAGKLVGRLGIFDIIRYIFGQKGIIK